MKLYTIYINIILILSLYQPLMAQYTRQDSLRGSLNHYRDYDVKHYDLKVSVWAEKKYISGSNEILLLTLHRTDTIQIDLFDNLTIDSIVYNAQKQKYIREGNATFVYLNEAIKSKKLIAITIYYHGNPIIAKMAPWDGGFTFKKTKSNADFIATSVQGIGASLWWPCKDHLSDEPDSMLISCTVPRGLMNVSNGRLINTQHIENTSTFIWKVNYPINNYGVALNITAYEHWQDIYLSAGDTLTLDYYVLPENLEKSKEWFQQVKPMLAAFEKRLGRFPFWKDGYKLVETPYLGMEHQSCIAYGNNYKKGYLGMDMSGQNLDFDYIIIHESGHEYWGNAVSMYDAAEMWIHEGFCTYSEGVYVEELYGYEVAMNYYKNQQTKVLNDRAIIEDFGVNAQPTGDQYFKGSLFLNTLRHVLNNDSVWWRIIYDFATTNVPRHASTQDFIDLIHTHTGKDYTPIFNQYLRHAKLPKLHVKWSKEGRNTLLNCYWECAEKDFEMPIKFYDGKRDHWITVNTTPMKLRLKVNAEYVVFDQVHFYYDIVED